MNRDILLMGLFAVAYLYLDSWTTLETTELEMDEAIRYDTGEPLRLFPRLTDRHACPRHAGHSVDTRADGAIWCRACDEGFFPESKIWELVAV